MTLPTNLVVGSTGHVGDHNEIGEILNRTAAFADTASDGVTDDSAVIQAAITALGADGGIVRVAPGVTLAKGLVLPSNVTLEGAGPGASTLKLPAAANTFLIESTGFSGLTGGATSGGTKQFGIRDIALDGNKANNSSTVPLVRLYGYDYRIERVRIRNSDDVGLWSEWGSSAADPGPDSMECVLDDVKVHGCDGTGVVWRGPHDASWDSVISYENAARGFDVDDNGGALVATNCHAWGNTMTEGWYIAAQVLASNCTAEGGNGVAQVVVDASDCQWDGGQIYAAGGTAVGVLLGDANAVQGCVIKTKILNCTSGAVDFNNDGGGNDLDLVIFHAPATAVFAGSRNGGTALRSVVSGSGTGGNELLWPHPAIVGGQLNVTADIVAIGGSLSAFTAGKGLKVAEGANAKMGTATLIAGAKTVATTAVTALSRIFVFSQSDGGTPGWLRVTARTAATSFVVTSSDGADTSTFAWILVDPA